MMMNLTQDPKMSAIVAEFQRMKTSYPNYLKSWDKKVGKLTGMDILSFGTSDRLKFYQRHQDKFEHWLEEKNFSLNEAQKLKFQKYFLACLLLQRYCNQTTGDTTFKPLPETLYALGLLYVITDEYLDDPAINQGEKQLFAMRVTKMIRGRNVAPENDVETISFDLFQIIEDYWPRNDPDSQMIYDNFEELHDWQIKSVKLQKLENLDKYSERDYLEVMMLKGAKTLELMWRLSLIGENNLDNEDQLMNVWRLGALIQIQDDLRDLQKDMKENNWTYPGKLLNLGKTLDEFTNKAFVYIRWVFLDNQDHVEEIFYFCLCHDLIRNLNYYSSDYQQQIGNFSLVPIWSNLDLKADFKRLFQECQSVEEMIAWISHEWDKKILNQQKN